MDKNHQGKTGNKQIATEEKLWIPSLSPNEQKKAERLQKKPFAERMGVAGKTPWDWVQLFIQLLAALALPIALFLAAQWFTMQQSQESEKTAATRYANDQQLAADQQRETTLQTYLDNMSDLLLKQNLAKSQAGEEVRQVAKQRTLTVLRRLDANRNRIVLQFLQDAQLISRVDTTGKIVVPIISLSGADLSNDNLRGVNLNNVDLSYTDLSQADLRSAVLSGADLRSAVLSGAHLSSANLWGAKLQGAYLEADLEAHLSGADLSGANLNYVDLSCNVLDSVRFCADLRSANLRGAYLVHASLVQADLRGANLRGAYLVHASLVQADLRATDLSGATLSGADLRAAKLDRTILKGAQYNTKVVLVKDEQGKILNTIPLTQWPQGFDPKAAGATEKNTFP